MCERNRLEKKVDSTVSLRLVVCVVHVFMCQYVYSISLYVCVCACVCIVSVYVSHGV